MPREPSEDEEERAAIQGQHFPHATKEQLAKAKTNGKQPYKVWLPAEIWAPIDPPIYALGSLTQGDVAMICAHGGSLKSWMGINAVLAKASGSKWLERFDSTIAGTIYVDNEMGPDECRRRFQINARAMGLSTPVGGVALVSMPGFYLSTPQGMREIEKLAEGRAVMVVDSLAAFSPDVDENDTRFADPLKRFKEIGDKTKCAFLLLHHSRKSKGDGDDKREHPRGTSALFAACDAVFQLTRKGDDGDFLVEQTKARKGKAVDRFVVHIQDLAPDSTRIWATDHDAATESVEAATSSLDRAKRQILVVLSNPQHDVRSGNDLVRRLKGVSRGAALKALKELQEHRQVDQDEAGRFYVTA